MSKKGQKKQRHAAERDPAPRDLAPKRPARKAENHKRPRPDSPTATRTAPARSGEAKAPPLWLFGRHAVMAALGNPLRVKKRLLLTKRSLQQYQNDLTAVLGPNATLASEIVPIEALENLLPDSCVHQGIALHTAPLPAGDLKSCCAITEGESHLVLVLDQVTDPHNVGAIIRSAAAFGARAILSPDRHSPPESGTLAKSASGALEVLPWIRVTNLSRALDDLADLGYWRLGLDGTATLSIKDADFGRNIALVMGAEGKGLRKGTQSHCDALIKLPIRRTVESLNVSNAAAIALYEFSR